MSTLEFFRDHAHRSPRGLVFAPRIAFSKSGLPRCRRDCSFTASVNFPHAAACSFESKVSTGICANSNWATSDFPGPIASQTITLGVVVVDELLEPLRNPVRAAALLEDLDAPETSEVLPATAIEVLLSGETSNASHTGPTTAASVWMHASHCSTDIGRSSEPVGIGVVSHSEKLHRDSSSVERPNFALEVLFEDPYPVRRVGHPVDVLVEVRLFGDVRGVVVVAETTRSRSVRARRPSALSLNPRPRESFVVDLPGRPLTRCTRPGDSSLPSSVGHSAAIADSGRNIASSKMSRSQLNPRPADFVLERNSIWQP